MFANHAAVNGKLVKSSRKRKITEVGNTSTNPFGLNPNKKRRPLPILCLDPDLLCRPIRSLTSLLNDDGDDNNISLENFQVPTDSIDNLIKSENEKLHEVRSESSVLWREMVEMAAEKLEVKNSQMQDLLRNYATMEEHVEEVASEAEFWKGKAKKMERKVRSLEAILEEIMSHERGEGVKDEGESSLVDGQPYEPVRLSCKVCGIRVANIMFWPCKHSRVCRRCDGNIGECPICKVSRRIECLGMSSLG